MRFFQNANYDFMKYRRHWAVVSTVLSLLGLSVIVLHRGLNVGIDFAGGTQVVVEFQKPPHPDELRAALRDVGLGDATLQRYGKSDSDQSRTRTRRHAKREEQSGAEIMRPLDQLYNRGEPPPVD